MNNKPLRIGILIAAEFFFLWIAQNWNPLVIFIGLWIVAFLAWGATQQR